MTIAKSLSAALLSLLLVVGFVPASFADEGDLSSNERGENSCGGVVQNQSPCDEELERQEELANSSLPASDGPTSEEVGTADDSSQDGSGEEDDADPADAAVSNETKASASSSRQETAESEKVFLICSTDEGLASLSISSSGAFLCYEPDDASMVSISELEENEGNRVVTVSGLDGSVLGSDDSGYVTTTKFDGSSSQRWLIRQSKDSSFCLENSKTGLYLGEDGGALRCVGVSSSSVIAFSSADTFPSKVESQRERLDAMAEENAKVLPDGNYIVTTSVNRHYSFDVDGGSKKKEAAIQLFSTHGCDNQVWEVSHDSDGYVVLTNVKSGMALDVARSNASEGAGLIQFPESGNYNQKWVAVPCGSGVKLVSALASGGEDLVVDLYGGKAKDGAKIQLFSDNETGNQIWNFEPASTQRERLDALAIDNRNVVKDGLYLLETKVSPSFALDVKNGSKSSGAAIQLYQNGGWSNQVWEVSHDSDGYVVLTNVKSGMALDVARSNASEGAGLIQFPESGNYNQKWVAVPCGSGVKLVSALASGGEDLVVDLYGGKAKDGAKIQLFSDNETGNQIWNLHSISRERVTLNDYAFSNKKALSEGTYRVGLSKSTNSVWDVNGGSKSNGASIQLYNAHGGTNQAWKVEIDTTGYVTFVNSKSGKALDVSNSSIKNGAPIIQYSKTGNYNQKWIVVKQGSDYKVVSALDSNYVLDATGGKTSNGTKLELFEDNGGAAQKWRFSSWIPSAQQKMLDKINSYSSKTSYLIAVNLSTHKVGVFTGSKGNWTNKYYWDCVTGASSSPTITGSYYTTGFKRTALTTDSRAKWATQINGGYFFHTILASNSELGKSLSHGCVRLATSNAKWIYSNIRAGTRVVLYR